MTAKAEGEKKVNAMIAIINDLCDTDPFHDGACIYCGAPSLTGQLFGPKGYNPDGQHFTRRDEHEETCIWRRALDASDGAGDGNLP